MSSLACHQVQEFEPRSALDVVVVSLVGLGCIPFVAANVVMLCNLKYQPIRQKNVDLTVASSAGGLIWLIATIIINRHFGPIKVGGSAICLLWDFWLQGALGFALWLNCLNVHLYSLHRILVLKHKNFKYWLLPLLIMELPMLAFCIAGSIFHASRRNESNTDCSVVTWWAVVYALLLLLYFFLFVFLAFRLRKVRTHYNEFGIIRKGGVIAMFLYLLSLVYLATDGNKKVVGRCFLTFSVATAVFYYFWARNATVVYAVLFNKADFLVRWSKYFDSNESLNEELDELNTTRATFKERARELEEEIVVLRSRTNSTQQVEKLRTSFSSSAKGFASMVDT
jgi:hypothetical protein